MSAPKDPIKNAEWRNKISKIWKGKKRNPFSKDHRRKLSEANKGKVKSEETRKKMRESHKGKTHSKEIREKISESLKGEKHPMYGKHLSEETRRKMSESIKGENHYNWKGGISFEPYCVKFDDPFRERCRNFFKRICVECGKTEVENKHKLHVHHVNFDKMACCNDVKPLYVALCRPCHAKTNFNRDYWEQHFTEIINNKYDGKCYLPKEC